MNKFSKKEAIKFGWSQVKTNLLFFAGVVLFVWVINFILGYLSEKIDETSLFLTFLIILASWILSLIFSIGLVKISLDFSINIKGKFSDLFSQYPLFLNYFLSSILYGLIILGGLILLIVPGIIWAIKFQFYPYFIVDKKLGPVEALKESAKITKDTKWNLFLFCIILGLMNMLGALAFFVGLLVTMPISIVAIAFVYRKLLSYKEIKL